MSMFEEYVSRIQKIIRIEHTNLRCMECYKRLVRCQCIEYIWDNYRKFFEEDYINTRIDLYQLSFSELPNEILIKIMSYAFSKNYIFKIDNILI